MINEFIFLSASEAIIIPHRFQDSEINITKLYIGIKCSKNMLLRKFGIYPSA